MSEKIVVCLDQSRLSRRVLPFAIDGVRRHGGKLILLHVCERNLAGVDIGMPGYPSLTPISAVVEEFSQRWNRMEAYLRKVASRIAAVGIDAQPVVLERSSTVAETIATYARANFADLIMMASHGRRGLKRILLGSVSLSVSDRSTVPVFVLEPLGPASTLPNSSPTIAPDNSSDPGVGPDPRIELDPA